MLKLFLIVNNAFCRNFDSHDIPLIEMSAKFSLCVINLKLNYYNVSCDYETSDVVLHIYEFYENSVICKMNNTINCLCKYYSFKNSIFI